MEAGDTIYQASSGMVKHTTSGMVKHTTSGMVKHTRVVSSPLASNMAGIYGQPGPTHGPTLGASGHFLFNNRPAIIYFDSRLTPEVVTRSSPYGYVKEQPMEVGDTMYPPSSGMVIHTRVVSSLLPVIWQVSCIYSMMTKVAPVKMEPKFQ